MRKGWIFAVAVGVATMCTGCANFKGLCTSETSRTTTRTKMGTSYAKYGNVPYGQENVALTVRFVSPPEDLALAAARQATDLKLVGDDETPATSGVGFASEYNLSAPGPQHVVLWGGPFTGQDVTAYSTPLSPGPYMFAYFDPDGGAAYQGWIAVNNGGDDILSALIEWRNTIRREQEWLAFENKLEGNFSSRKHGDFDEFTKQLDNLRKLEARIDKVVRSEMNDYQRQVEQQAALLSGAEVLVMPGPANFFRPSTAPTFDESDLVNVRDGKPVTKVVLAGDYVRSMEKLRRVMDLQEDLQRCRWVFIEEVNRLENRRHFYRLTDHLYHHGRRFVENERKLQDARGLIARIDQQLQDNTRRVHALLFVTGLFAPDEAFKVFDQQQAAMQREKIVLQEQKRILDSQFEQIDELNDRRVFLERQRQSLMADIDKLNGQFEEVEQTRVAVANLHNSTNIIHRQGPACVLTATLKDNGLPARFVDAVEREALMTVRLQATDSVFTPPNSVAEWQNIRTQETTKVELVSQPEQTNQSDENNK